MVERPVSQASPIVYDRPDTSPPFVGYGSEPPEPLPEVEGIVASVFSRR
jgi:hypothetical protein